MSIETKTVSIAGGPPEPASRWVWHIADLAVNLTAKAHCVPVDPFGNSTKPEVGDIVVEWTHRLAFGKVKLGLHSAIGHLRAIEKDANGGEVYIIESLDESVGVKRWENGMIALVEKASSSAAGGDA